jgi:hypothetical protein
VFIQCNLEVTEQDKEVDNANKALERFEMFEVLMRLARLKYMSGHPGPTASSESESLRKLFEEHIVKYSKHVDKDSWREARMYNAQVDSVIRHYQKSIKEWYESLCHVEDKANFGRQLKIPNINYESYLRMCDFKHLLANDDAIELSKMSKAEQAAHEAAEGKTATFGKRGASLAYLRSRMMMRDEMEVWC